MTATARKVTGEQATEGLTPDRLAELTGITTTEAEWVLGLVQGGLAKGFVLQEDQLASAQVEELVQRVRAIRTSEKRVYGKVRDLFAGSTDYAGNSTAAREFFRGVQNRLLHAATGLTGPDIVAARADATAPDMGLTTWDGDHVTKADAQIAKNYLTPSELAELNRLTAMFLDFAEDRVSRHGRLPMEEWSVQVDRFLEFYERPVPAGPPSSTSEEAADHASGTYAQYAATHSSRRRQSR